LYFDTASRGVVQAKGFFSFSKFPVESVWTSGVANSSRPCSSVHPSLDSIRLSVAYSAVTNDIPTALFIFFIFPSAEFPFPHVSRKYWNPLLDQNIKCTNVKLLWA